MTESISSPVVKLLLTAKQFLNLSNELKIYRKKRSILRHYNHVNKYMLKGTLSCQTTTFINL